jgi:hypothetical protein
MDEELRRQLPPEYAALGDPRVVMHEVAQLLAKLHSAGTRLGDALVAAGLPERVWRTWEADLSQLSNQLPALTVDELLTHLAEFTAGTGPAWLHGGRADLETLQDEAAGLHETLRALRNAAQRLRLMPAHERGINYLDDAFGNPRVGTALDSATSLLSDLTALGPFMAPLAPKEWNEQPPLDPIQSPAQDTVTPAFLTEPAAPTGGGAQVADSYRQRSAPRPARSPSRLRDFAPTRSLDVPSGSTATRSPFDLRQLILQWWHAAQAMVREHRQLSLMASVILVLLVGLGVLQATGAGRPQPAAPQPPTALVAAPTRLTLACAAHGSLGAATTLVLKNPTRRALSWRISAPAGMLVSPASGTLMAGRSASLSVRTSSTVRLSGMLTLAATDGQLAIPYAVACR